MANIQFEHIDPYIEGQGGDTGQSSRLKLRRNFEKIKAWMDSVASQLSGKFLKKDGDDEAEGVITFRKGSLFGPNGAWGWVKETFERTLDGATHTYNNGVAWFHWLLADRLEVTGIAQFLSHLYIKGSSQIDGNLTVGTEGNENTGNIDATGSINAGKDVTAGRDGRFGRDLNVLNGTTTTKNLVVTGSMHVFELIIDKVKSAGGSLMLTPANGTVAKVDTVSGAKRVYFLAKDKDGKAITHDWEVGDGALCMTNNLANGTSYNVQNRYYWARVVGKGTVTIDDCSSGENQPIDYHYIDLSTSDKDPSCTVAPMEGDDLVQLGWRDITGNSSLSELDIKGRQSALYMAAYMSLDRGYDDCGQTVKRALVPPLIAYYEGIDDFNLSRHRTTFKDSLGGRWVGDLEVVAGGMLDNWINDKLEHFDPKADFYRLRPVKEDAWVAADKTLAVALRYQLEHVSKGTSKTEAWTGSGYTVVVKANGTGSALSGVSYSTGTAGEALFAKNYGATATKPDYYTVALVKGAVVIDQRVVRVEMKAGTVFSVTDAGMRVATQAVNQMGDSLRSELATTAEGIRSEVSSLKISKNLLLNSDFDEETESGRGAIHLVPTRRWQGYQQESRNAQGDWVARLTRNKKYTLSLYARGSGYGGALVHLVNVSTGDAVGDQPFINIENLTSHWKRYSRTFTVPSTANRGFRVMLGSMYGSAAAISGADIEIARPQLEEGEKATLYTATGSRNLLANSTFDNVSKNKPEGWTYWENAESGSIVEPTTREIVAEKVLAFWGEWNGTGGTVAPKVQEIRVDGVNGWKYLHVEPADMFQGIIQDSSVRSGGEWKGVLQHGGWYVLSFYARGLGRSDGLLHLVKRNGQHISQPQPQLIVEIVDSCHADAWNRYQTQPFQAIPSSSADYDVEHGYGFSLMLGCSHYSEDPDYHVPSEVIEIARPQLEEGQSASDWRRGEENPELVATRFEQSARKLELAVYRDGVKRSGMKIDEDGVELDGKTTKINGDLDLQGLTTENVTAVTRNPRYPTVINMGIVENGEEVVKSVQVFGDADSASTDIGNHIVVLPFYDEVNSKWTEKYSGITLNGDDTFNLYGDKKVVQWKKSGTKLSVTNSVIFRYRNWQENIDPNYADMLAGMVVVCSDGRVISKGNIDSERPYNPSTDADGSLMQPQLHAGLFSCGGYIARFIVLLPGQTLQLRSQIVLSGYRKVLVWVVENPTEFVPFFSSSKASKIEFVTYPDGSSSGTLDYISNIASFNPTVHYHGSAETIMVPAAMNYRSDRVLVFSELYP